MNGASPPPLRADDPEEVKTDVRKECCGNEVVIIDCVDVASSRASTLARPKSPSLFAESLGQLLVPVAV